MVRVATVQTDVVFDSPSINAERAREYIESLAAKGVQVIILPEAFLTGYCVEEQELARSIAIDWPFSSEAVPRDHPLQVVREAAERAGVVVIVGFAERDDQGVYNSAAIFEPDAEPRKYNKTHLPFLGFDRFVTPGEDLPVFETKFGRIGVLICFDVRHPEPARVLAMKGAQLIVVPTNWPEGAEISADVLAVARAAESRVFVASSNRVGEENGFRFIGKSKIIDPTGRVLQSADHRNEEVLVADLDLAQADIKRTRGIPGRYETTVFESRRPELYAVLSEDSASSADQA
ncbi:MAG: carbon-nitrogen hydrolase family protein [Fimbriimonadaceae bacterium]